MNALLRLTAITSHHDVKEPRWLCDAIEANDKGLKVLDVELKSYGSVMVSILMNKMSSEVRLIVSGSLKSEKWDFNEVMQIMEQELRRCKRTLLCTNPTDTLTTEPPLHVELQHH